MKIEIKDYVKELSGNTVLNHISLTFESGKIYGLSGKNGSGKTMLMRAICGLIRPTEGFVSIDGAVIGKDISFPPSVGVLIESPSFISYYSGFKNLQLLASIKNIADDDTIKGLMTRLDLDPENKKRYKKYSMGMKQKIGIIAAVMEKPDLIILDEPINALDEKSAQTLKEMLNEYKEDGALIIISCHDREELEFLSDEIIYLADGKVKENRTEAEE